MLPQISMLIFQVFHNIQYILKTDSYSLQWQSHILQNITTSYYSVLYQTSIYCTLITSHKALLLDM